MAGLFILKNEFLGQGQEQAQSCRIPLPPAPDTQHLSIAPQCCSPRSTEAPRLLIRSSPGPVHPCLLHAAFLHTVASPFFTPEQSATCSFPLLA